MKRMLSVLVIAALCAALSFAAPSASGKKKRIAIVPVALNNPIFLDAIEAAKKAGADLGAEVIVTASANPDAAEQVKVVEGLIEQKVDGILLFPVDSKALKGIVDKAVDKGIIVGILNSDIPDSKRAFYAGTDNYALGKACGERIAKLMGGKGKVAVQTGVVGMAALDDRVRGFRDVIKGSKIEEVAFQANDDSTEKSIELINTYLSAHPELNGYFVDGGWPFFAPPASLPELVKFRARGGVYGTVDSFFPMFKYLDRPDPLADFMIGQDYTAMGDYGTRAIYKLLSGGKVEQKVFYTPLEVCTKDNFKEILAKKKAW